ncbi:NAD(P)-binding protein [Modestobacter sp. I12A-02628]|uniref:FAD-dependent oxidoreductase n=1 Tax=Goekera deserti TaxID=2497753 RepID=A0A7K3WEY1_9ACTN|nr:FAD-dependent oxidoreductase [Goekera deserti]MPQ97980.1 NAD(P)-binding protein [Goekera deserti]NDI48627.1 FAD-dependent oxidoreductase [Goekera deserti]NEL54994.1 FAD-dependent oxidoreductase [Goekera deserti]
MSRRSPDLLVIGAGTAGLVAARTAAALGARVLLVERDRFGGDCLWTGCVPSKALLAAAEAAAAVRGAARFGLHAEVTGIDTAQVMASVRRAITAIEPDDAPQTQHAKGVRTATGDVAFTGPDTVTVDGEPLRFRRAVVATGSHPVLPDVPGLADADPLTSDSLWDLTGLPGRVAVLGGGAIGCELGQAMARLGVQVTLVEPGPRLLAGEDPAAAALVQAALVRDGVDVRTGRHATGVEAHRLHLDDGATVTFDRLLVAAGRAPRTDGLGLAAAGIQRDERGNVRVDAQLATTNPRVWAAGDVTGHPRFTHLAGVHGSLAAGNAVLGLRRSVRLDAVPRVTYTSPELAAVGAPTAEDAERPAGHRVLSQSHEHSDRAVTDQRTDGVTRLVVDGRRRVVGATVVGARAGESLAELTLAVTQGLTTTDLAGTVHPYPAYTDPTWDAAVADATGRLQAGPARLAVTVLRRLAQLRAR